MEATATMYSATVGKRSMFFVTAGSAVEAARLLDRKFAAAGMFATRNLWRDKGRPVKAIRQK